MDFFRKNLKVFCISLWPLVLFLTMPGLAYGYIDPGSGSYLFQLLIASLLGGLYAIKLFWQKIRTFFKSTFGKKDVSSKDHS